MNFDFFFKYCFKKYLSEHGSRAYFEVLDISINNIYVFKTKNKSGNAILKGVRDVDNIYENGYYKYTTGATSSVDAANNLKAEVARKFPDAFLIAYKKGKKINIHTAIKEATEINK